MWHDSALNNWDVLRPALGIVALRTAKRDYARILTRLLVKETGADLVALACDAALSAAQIADQARRQQDGLTALSILAARGYRPPADAPVGRVTPNIAVQGPVTLDALRTPAIPGGRAGAVGARPFP
ncbi:MAG: hypothetical protein FJX25_09805 [Alphaproteobacteria bacterium]|nr:hypothetical protein [Alphaproteobacteria bacterium]